MSAGLTRRERIRDLREFHGAIPVDSANDMAARIRMDPAQRATLDRLLEEQAYLLKRGRPDPRLDPALAEAAEGGADYMGWRVAVARAKRECMRRALGLPLNNHELRRGGALDALSLCAGIGGLDIGLKRAIPEARVVCYVEGYPACLQILLGRMGGGVLDEAPVYGNLRSFDGERWRGVVDLVAGGFPCQPFSTAGKRRGGADRRHLWPEFARVLREIRPEWGFFENVDGLFSTLELRGILDDLAGLGYRVALGVFPASELGAPQKRERLFILAHADAQPQPQGQEREPDAADGRGGGRAGARREEPAARVEALGDSRAPLVARPRPLARLPSSPECGDRPYLWPPGRDSWQAWRAMQQMDPELMPWVPEDDRLRRNPAFDEWLMGFPRGWTEGVPRIARCAALGNAVVPTAAALAWLELSAALSAS